MSARFRVILALLVSSLPCLLAQTGASSVSGTVSDASGSSVPAAQVTLTHDATGITLRQSTTGAGLFAFPAIPAGSYSLSIEKLGFKTLKRDHLTVQVSTPVNLDLALSLGESSETIIVSASAEALQTSNAALGNVIEQKAIADLPLNGRNPLTLLVLEPGVVQRSGNTIAVNGARSAANNVTIDGIDANESSNPSAVNNVFRLSPDAVQEFKVTTSNATPEEGRNSGASISIATRSGSNEFHGRAFHFFRNTALNANEFFAQAQGNQKPEIKSTNRSNSADPSSRTAPSSSAPTRASGSTTPKASTASSARPSIFTPPPPAPASSVTSLLTPSTPSSSTASASHKTPPSSSTPPPEPSSPALPIAPPPAKRTASPPTTSSPPTPWA